MKYTLYYSTTSGYVRRVLVLLNEFNLISKTKLIQGLTPNALENHPNPLKKIPTLLTDKGVKIFDSNVICQYLDEKHNDSRFFKANNIEEKYKLLTTNAVSLGIIDAAALIVNERKKEQVKISNSFIDAQLLKINSGLNYQNTKSLNWNISTWNIATITSVVAWDYLKFRLSDDVDFNKYSSLMEWRATINKSSIDKTMPYE